jgi:hypothetical protein
MIAALAPSWPAGGLQAAVSCATNSAGQTVCTSAGLFAGLGILLFLYLVIAVLGIIAGVKVITKAGYSGWWILITFIPFVGAVFVFIFAFSKWPVLQEVEMLRARLASTGGYGRPGGYGAGPYYGGPRPNGPPAGAPSAPTGQGLPPTPPGPGEPAAPDAAIEQTPIPTFGQFLQGGIPPTIQVPGTPPPSPPDMPSEQPPAGWFPAPGGAPGQLRYWDGSRWTDHFN